MRDLSEGKKRPIEEAQVRRPRKAKLERVSYDVTKGEKAKKGTAATDEAIQGARRETGIDILGDVTWGTHFCLFYQGKQDLIDILIPYFKAGLENNEFCMWITSEPLNAENAKKSLKQAVPNVDDYIKKGQMEILEYSDWYTKSGNFEADRVLQGWVEKHDQAIKNGFDGLRLTGNTFWLEKKDWQDFTDYEAAVNDVIGRYKMLAICIYSLERCNAAEVVDVVSNHQFALIKQEGAWKLIESSERKKVEDRLRFYAAITANMSEGVYAVRAADGVIVHNNPKFEQMFCYGPGELAGKHVSIVNAPTEKSPQETAEQIIEVLNQEGTWRGEILNIKKDGTPFWCYASVSTFEHLEHGKVWVTMHTDITERKKTEEQIAKLAKFPSENPNPVLRISKDCRILYANKASSVVLETWAINVGQRLPEACCKRVKEALSSGKVSRFEFECHDGRTFEVTLAPVIELGYVNAYGLDITGRKKAEEKLIEDWEKLKFLASQLTLAEERERRRIATELHDRISQSLVISKIRLDGLRHSVSPEDPVKVMEEVCGSLGQAIADIRSLTFDLSSPILHELGFEAAVEALLADQIEQKHDIATEFDDDGQAKPLDDDIRAILFRNVRELIFNIVKHANANKVKVSIRRIGSQIRVSIEDDGIGFDPAKVASRSVREGGFGLFSIRERLAQLGGSLEIESGPKRGTEVTMLAPLKEGDIRNERK